MLPHYTTYNLCQGENCLFCKQYEKLWLSRKNFGQTCEGEFMFISMRTMVKFVAWNLTLKRALLEMSHSRQGPMVKKLKLSRSLRLFVGTLVDLGLSDYEFSDYVFRETKIHSLLYLSWLWLSISWQYSPQTVKNTTKVVGFNTNWTW